MYVHNSNNKYFILNVLADFVNDILTASKCVQNAIQFLSKFITEYNS